MQKLENILQIITNIYEITNNIHNLVLSANSNNENISEELKEMYRKKSKLINLLEIAKTDENGKLVFKENIEYLSKEYKRIADTEIVTMKLLESKIKEMAQKLKGLQRSKGLLIYQKGHYNESRKF